MRMQRYSSGRGRMPRRLTALFLATTMTVGTAPAAFASESDVMLQTAIPRLRLP